MGDVVPSSGAPFLTTTLRTSCGTRCHAVRAVQNRFEGQGACQEGTTQHKRIAVVQLEVGTNGLTSSAVMP